MNSYDKLRAKAVINKTARDEISSKFIQDDYLGSVITVGASTQSAALVWLNKEGLDKLYVYVKKTSPLAIGSNFSFEGKHFLVSERDWIVYNTSYYRYQAWECNFDIDGVWGYFIGPEKTAISTKLLEKSINVSTQDPLVVFPQGHFEISDKIVIKNRPWQIIESDIISNDYVGYYSLKSTSINKVVANNEEEEEEENVNNNLFTVSALQTVTLDTDNGYFVPSKTLDNVTRNSSSVSFVVPFGINDFTVDVKRSNQVVELSFRVVS